VDLVGAGDEGLPEGAVFRPVLAPDVEFRGPLRPFRSNRLAPPLSRASRRRRSGRAGRWALGGARGTHLFGNALNV
jgi:hypothetical protein